MDHYIVSARKYRPATFDSVVGQKALTATLKNAISSGRLAHSYLFCGSRGVGKTSCARILAKTINCLSPTAAGEACNECDSCRAFNEGNSLNIIELDAASNNSVDDIRSLTEQVMVGPVNGRYRVFIVDEVHMLTQAAFNAFLKTLEEPPAHAIFILATTEKHKIIPTILSRCQIYDFSPIGIADIVKHLAHVASQEGITAEPAALGLIARKADGAMRDALSIFDQVAASTRGNITYAAALDNLNILDFGYFNRLTEAFLAGDTMASWMIYKEIRDRGFDSHFFINGLAAYMRDLMVARDPSTAALLDADADTSAAMAAMAKRCTPDFLYRAMCLLNDADLNYRIAANKQFLTELTLARICQLSSPSPAETDGGQGEGLKPIAAKTAPAPTPSAAPIQTPSAAPAPTPVAVSAAAAKAAPPHPAAPHRPAPAQRPATARGGMRLSLGGAARGNAPEAAQASAAQLRTTAYTDDDFKQVWNSFIRRNPSEVILINTMRASRPRRQSEGSDIFTVTVENTAQQQKLAEAMPQLLAELHDSLANDNVTLNVVINQGKSGSHTWSEREVLAKMMENNPSLKNLIDTFKMNIG